MAEPKIHISRAIWDEDTYEVAYVVDGVMTADVATQRKLNAVDDMYEALGQVCKICKKQSKCILSLGIESESCFIMKALRKARDEK